jgi:nicotinate dehydrogenase subunit B
LLGGGALVVSLGAALSLETVLSVQQAYAQGAKPPLTPDQLSSYIAINADGSVTAYFGKIDAGQGLHVAIGQMVAEERRRKRAACWSRWRLACCPCRPAMRICLPPNRMPLALDAPDRLVVHDGTVSVADDRSKRISYAQMLGRSRNADS